MPTRVERYLAHLDALSGGVEPDFTQLDAEQPGAPRVTSIRYQDLPEPGIQTALTYGLSLGNHPDWRHGKPELAISVRSTDPHWGLAIAHLAAVYRGDCPFSYGNTLSLGEPVTPETQLSAFVVFAPLPLEPEDAHVDVGDPLPIHVVGMYPIHESERHWIGAHGLESFWKLGWDPYDVTRPPAI